MESLNERPEYGCGKEVAAEVRLSSSLLDLTRGEIATYRSFRALDLQRSSKIDLAHGSWEAKCRHD